MILIKLTIFLCIIAVKLSNGLGSESEEINLFSASLHGKVLDVRKAVGRGMDVNVQDDNGHTPLMLACAHGHLEVVKYLLLKGADSSLQNKLGDKTALLISVHKNYTEIVDALLVNGADINQSNIRGDTAALVTAYEGNLPLMKYLQYYGANMNHRTTTNGYYVLHLASFQGHSHIINYLLQQEMDPDVVDFAGKTSLMLAAMEGHINVTRVLMEYQADCNIQDWLGNTALMFATIKNQTKIVDYLLEKQCSLKLQNKNKENILFLAIRNAHVPLVETILLHGLEYYMSSSLLSSALILAKGMNHEYLIQLLEQFLI
jgi:uncharacterized protein